MRTTTLCLFLLATAPLAAQSLGSINEDAPKLGSSYSSKALQLSVEYKAIAWGEGKVMAAVGQAGVRKMINDAAKKSPLGKLRAKKDFVIAGKAMAKGTYSLSFHVGDDAAWQLVLTKGRTTESVPLPSGDAAESSDRLSLALVAAKTVDGASLRVAFGPMRAKLNVAAPGSGGQGGDVDEAVAAIRAFIQKQNVNTRTDRWRFRLPKPPKVEFTEGKSYFWNLETSEGPVRVEFMPRVAPMHVSNAIYLTELGFYDSLVFHRVITAFMAQGGCPAGNGSGSPGYAFGGEFDPDVKHDRPGLLSMANAGPNTDGSQFFLTFVKTPHLDGLHTIYGEVVEGMQTLKKLEANGSASGRTRKPMSIVRATVSVE